MSSSNSVRDLHRELENKPNDLSKLQKGKQAKHASITSLFLFLLPLPNKKVIFFLFLLVDYDLSTETFFVKNK